MSFSVKLKQVLDDLDIDGFKNLFQDDFVYVDNYEMMTSDDYISLLIKQWAEIQINFSRAQNTLVDNQDIFSFQFTRDIDGVPYKITNVSLLTDGKFWRSQIHRAPV
ncbi:MAG: hypothetical protein P8I83_00835, partial [Paracoccaceae bacterium]|nr:hypothetical protein [Paracoccaceae bacterium]